MRCETWNSNFPWLLFFNAVSFVHFESFLCTIQIQWFTNAFSEAAWMESESPVICALIQKDWMKGNKMAFQSDDEAFMNEGSLGWDWSSDKHTHFTHWLRNCYSLHEIKSSSKLVIKEHCVQGLERCLCNKNRTSSSQCPRDSCTVALPLETFNTLPPSGQIWLQLQRKHITSVHYE